MKVWEPHLLQQHLLRELDELVEVQLDPELLAVVVAAHEPAQRLDPLVPGALPARAGAPGPASRPLGEELGLLGELQGRQIQRGDLGLDLAVDDQLLLLDQLVEVLLEVLAQVLIVLVLGDPPSVDLH